MKFSLRALLVGLWVVIVVICLALALLMRGLFQLGIEAQTGHVRGEVERAAESMAKRFGVYLASFDAPPESFASEDRRRELQLVVGLVLADFREVEGGFWSRDGEFLAYGFPTYEGGSVKKDLPEAERERIAGVARAAADAGAAKTRIFHGESQALVLSARPAGLAGLVAWTMSRAHIQQAAAYEKLTLGLATLFGFALLSGAAVLWFLHRWSRRVAALQATIAAAPADDLPILPETGQRELDRLVAALNALNGRLRDARERASQLSRELARADRLAALGRLAAGVAHEIRNPIAAIRLRAENALAKADEHRRAALEFVLVEIRRLDDLLERLLAMTRLEQLQPRATPVQPWLAARAESVREQAAQAGVALSVEAEEIVCPLDENAMNRALGNLLLNALQHTPRGGWVKLSARVAAEACVIAVEDSGDGVPAEKREAIFEPFATGRADGSGLGLSIARQIVEAHGGEIRCVAGAAGARFEIELPCRKS